MGTKNWIWGLTKDFLKPKFGFARLINVVIYCSEVDMFIIWSKKLILHCILHGFVL
jgi:hypothetical protein